MLQKYFEAESTLDEENDLINYFNSGEVEEELKPFVPIFSGLKDLAVNEDEGLGEDLMNYILESEHKEKVRYRWMWQMVTAVAAAVILVMLGVNFYSNQSQWEDTFTDPKQAYAEASKTLEFVAGKYNKGLAMLKPLGKVEAAATPFYSGMAAWNKGIGKLENINKNLKKQ
ncbi:MAG TPA: hypothetical protein DCL77_16945 [Prolixibacteraceae bacterium]|nr:hypothetical protein [Prolixibacteraceae bacterium]